MSDELLKLLFASIFGALGGVWLATVVWWIMEYRDTRRKR
jgi:hypothetical protein